MSNNSTPPLVWLRAEGAEAAEARELVLSIFDATDAPKNIEEARRLPGSLREAGGEFWVARLQEIVVGTLGLRPCHAENANIIEGNINTVEGNWRLCWWTVATGNRGLGIGNWMLDNSLRWLKEKGAKSVSALIELNNEPAIAALKSTGFKSSIDLRRLKKEEHATPISFVLHL